ncbi:MAG: ABC transporter permease [Chloroflexi bacterium]|nr:ABC transporter permease [Chloroflexota bacterium]
MVSRPAPPYKNLLPSKAAVSTIRSLWIRLIKLVKNRFEYFLIPFSIILFIAGWKLIIRTQGFPEYILPEPEAVWDQLVVVIENGYIFEHVTYTLTEALYGFLASLLFATSLGYILGKSRALEKAASPYIVAAKSIPILGIAPLIIIWFGQGITPKAIIAFLIIFFPMLVNTIVGIRSVNEDQRELMRSYSASKWQVFIRLELPAAMPLLLAGIKIGLARSMMGAIVGEYLGGQQGLGFLVNLGSGLSETPLIFASIFTIIIITLILYGSAAILEGALLKGRRRDAV